jgi:uncharacterized membrane protein YfhO
MWIEKITGDLISKMLSEIQKENNMTVIQHKILDPIISIAFSRLYPYILTTSIIFFLTFILAVAILLLVLNK